MEDTKPSQPCPFCKSKNLGISNKTTTSNYRRKRHISVYCKKCHCYGPRIMCNDDGTSQTEQIATKQAVNAWDTQVLS